MANVVNIIIQINTLHLTVVDDLTTVASSGFIMRGNDITITLGAGSSSFASLVTTGTGANTSQEIRLNSSAVSGEVILSFTCQDATNANNVYWINGVVFKREITTTSGTSNTTSVYAPIRFSDIRGAGTSNLSISYNCTSPNLNYDYFLLIQNATTGAIGLIDPRMATR